MALVENFIKPYLKKELPNVKPGDEVRVSQKIPAFAPAAAEALAGKKASADKKEGEKVQVFEGTVIAKAHGKEIGATLTVRRVISGIGVERIFPLHSPTIEKIEILKRGKVRRAKLYYLRKIKGKKAKLKGGELPEVVAKEKLEEIKTEDTEKKK